MPAIVRVTDIDSSGDTQDIGSSDVFTNNLQTVRVLDTDSSNDIQVTGSSNVFVDNLQVVRVTDIDSSGDSQDTGSPDVYIGDSTPSGSAIFANTTPEAAVTITLVQQTQYESNVANVAKYNTPDNIANGVDEHPEMPDDPANPPAPTPPAVANPDCAGGAGDMGTALDQALSEASNGQWRETGDNPNIVALYANVGFPQFKSDSTAWCAGFVGSELKKNCFKFLKSLSAGSYTGYGNPVSGGISNAQRGDVLIFNRDGGSGHVTFYDGPGPRPGTVYVIGGNQHDNVTRAVKNVSELKADGVQRPIPA